MARNTQRPISGNVSRTALGSRRQQGYVAIETGSGATEQGAPNQPAVLSLDAVDASGNVTSWYMWVNRNGVLRISSTFPVNELTDGSSVGSQT